VFGGGGGGGGSQGGSQGGGSGRNAFGLRKTLAAVTLSFLRGRSSLYIECHTRRSSGPTSGLLALCIYAAVAVDRARDCGLVIR